jgi:hypothetical protein
MRLKNCPLSLIGIILSILMPGLPGSARSSIRDCKRLTADPVQFKKTEFSVTITAEFANPYDSREVALDMILRPPSGPALTLPCYYDGGDAESSVWKARFTPRESGEYTAVFRLSRGNRAPENSGGLTFRAAPSSGDGFLRASGFWTLRFDSGKPFRGIGENVGWEARDFEDPKYTFEYLLTSLSANGANFIRSWMCPWSLPLEWKKVSNKKRYADSDAYFNPGGVSRTDEFIRLADSLGIYIMLALDSHNALIENNQWEVNNYNAVNGGPAVTPAEFFTLEASRAMYKNRLRYLVARWGYSPSIAAWEFFNEIDNAVFTSSPENRALIPPGAVTEWHDEMSRYLKSIDPYGHIVTTSVSHRDIAGMNDLPALDLNQKHIYKRTGRIRSEILANAAAHRKPYVIGEFAYEWDWNIDFSTIAAELDEDYKRGLWAGLFSPTPVLPMTWWWEFFDARGMTPYLKSVREISDKMLEAGHGSFDTLAVRAPRVESYAVRCGQTIFVCLLNTEKEVVETRVEFPEITGAGDPFDIRCFRPIDRKYEILKKAPASNGRPAVPAVSLPPMDELILILSPG